MSSLGFQTGRIVARPIRSGDRANCLRTRMESELSFRQAKGDFLTLSQIDRARFERMIARRERWAAHDEHYVLGLFLKDSGCFIGDTLLFNIDRTIHARGEIGLVIYSRFQTMGYGPECITGTIAWGLGEPLGLEEVYGHIEDGNHASTIACLRAGFRLLTSAPVPRRFEGETQLCWPISVRSLP
ncbi:MAG TPA: GNAT family N-acetyltransferase [Thermoanaerobaculia bacterium]|nr:GNAT family N-acetyltransferase [Thermoanaerobaculia bacterium]